MTMMLLSVMALGACRPMPQVDDVRTAVEAHFGGRGYPVVELSVQSIRPLANREKTYMGVPTYVVELSSLVLRVNGQKRTFRDVRMQLKKSRSQGNLYIVSDITGVPLP